VCSMDYWFGLHVAGILEPRIREAEERVLL